MTWRGQTIEIYLPHGNPQGLKICEIKNSIVKAYFIPRSKIPEINANWKEDLKNPGIYFLFGEKNEIGKVEVYVGEAEQVFWRVQQHNKEKDFRVSCICFISGKKNLNKAHIKCLENLCYKTTKETKKSIIKNTNEPTASSLTEQEESFVRNFFDDIKIILGALGHSILEETTIKKTENNWTIENQEFFYCRGKWIEWFWFYSDTGFTISQGSQIHQTETKSLHENIKLLRKEIIENEVVDKNWFFQENFTFSSPSSAASIILWRSANGRTERKNEKGVTLDEKIRQQQID